MTVSDNTLRAAICVALKSASKDVRKGFQDRDWQVREKAERAIARIVMDGLAGFDISRKPDDIPKAPSVLAAEEQLREVFPDHDADAAMRVIKKTIQ